MFLLLVPTFVVADELEIVGTAVRVRNTPSTNGIKLAEVNSGKRYPLKSATKVADIEGCKEGWYNVLIDGQDGYVCSRYARIIVSEIVNVDYNFFKSWYVHHTFIIIFFFQTWYDFIIIFCF